jgi:hypothetical protein
MPFLSILWSALTSKLAGPLAALVAVSLAIALSVSAVQKGELRRQLSTAEDTIGQLKGSLDFQNRMVSDLGTKTAVAQALVKAAQKAARTAHSGDAALVATLVAKSVETDPVLACKAADDAILEHIK